MAYKRNAILGPTLTASWVVLDFLGEGVHSNMTKINLQIYDFQGRSRPPSHASLDPRMQALFFSLLVSESTTKTSWYVQREET